MKDFKSFLIGFLTCTCIFLFMGFSSTSTMYDADDIMRKLKDIDGNLFYGLYYKIDCNNIDEADCNCY